VERMRKKPCLQTHSYFLFSVEMMDDQVHLTTDDQVHLTTNDQVHLTTNDQVHLTTDDQVHIVILDTDINVMIGRYLIWSSAF